MFASIAIVIMVIMYGFLITEKFQRVVVVWFAAMLVVLSQVLQQDQAFAYIGNNLWVLGFIIGMTIIIGIVKQSGVFEYLALSIIKRVQWHRLWLMGAIALLTRLLTIFLSNIPTVLILTPILIILIRQLRLPAFPYFLLMLTIANIAGATTPISDPTTYYQSQQVGLWFMEVISNSWLIAMVLCVVTVLYVMALFHKQCRTAECNTTYIEKLTPKDAIVDKKLMWIGIPLLAITIFSFVIKDRVATHWHIYYDNAVIALSIALCLVAYSRQSMTKVLTTLIDWDTIFFFMWLFIVIGWLEHTGVIAWLGEQLVVLAHGDITILLGLVTMGSGFLSTFIDNVPYNITMVSAIKAMAASGIAVYPLRRALNLGTSFGGAGSPIGAACSVVSLGEADKDHIHFNFLTYMRYAFPLVIINGIITFALLYRKFMV